MWSSLQCYCTGSSACCSATNTGNSPAALAYIPEMEEGKNMVMSSLCLSPLLSFYLSLTLSGRMSWMWFLMPELLEVGPSDTSPRSLAHVHAASVQVPQRCCVFAFKMHLRLSDWMTVTCLCFYVLSNATPEASFVYFHTVFACRKAPWGITDANTLGSHHYYGSMMCPDSWPATRNVSGGVCLQESLPLSRGYDSYLANTWHERSCGDDD